MLAPDWLSWWRGMTARADDWQPVGSLACETRNQYACAHGATYPVANFDIDAGRSATIFQSRASTHKRENFIV
jgi:hypothetical protein